MKKLLILVAMFAIVAVLVVAQGEINPDAEESSFLDVGLPAGFLPDPFIVTAIAGGGIDASEVAELPSECAGFIARVPDVRVNWTTGDSVSSLRVFFVSEEDTTLVVQTPSGEYLCNDDANIEGAEAFSPAVDILETEDGVYNIWVGTFNADENAPGYVMLTERAETYPGQIVSTILGEVVAPEAE